MKGWVYIITNAAMPDLVKIGYSTKDPDLRAAELNNTGSPLPYIVAYEILIRNPYQIEQKAHVLLRDYREGKEWFRCTPAIAVRYIREAADGLGLMEDVRILITEPTKVESEEDIAAREKELNRQHVFRLAKRIHNIKAGATNSGIVLDELKRFAGPELDIIEVSRCVSAIGKVDNFGLTPEQLRNSVVAIRCKMAVGAPPSEIINMLEATCSPSLGNQQARRIFYILANETGYDIDSNQA